MNTAKKLSIRLEAVGGDKVRQEFKNIGSDGQKAFQRITQVITPANDNLKILDNTAKAFNNTLKQAASLAGAYLGLRGLTNTFKSIVETNKEFERLSGSLKTVTGSAKAAKEAFTLIEDFATSTPFQLDEIVDSFIRLKAMGLEPSMEALISYGNTASAFGKNILEFVSAVTSATVGEFERLKTFGIKAKVEGELVKFIFQGITTEVGKNAVEIENYLRSIGTINFGGAMAEQMNTMGGTMSNIEDALAKVARTIGENGLNKAIKEVLDQFNNLISGTDGAAKTIGETLASAVTIAGKAFFTLAKYIEPIITLLTVRLGASLITKGIDLLKASVYALNVALMGTGTAGASATLGLKMMWQVSKVAAVQMYATAVAAKVLAGAVGLLKGIMALLGGPAGLVMLVVYGLYKLIDSHNVAKRAANDHADTLAKLKEQMAETVKETNNLVTAQSKNQAIAEWSYKLKVAEKNIKDLKEELKDTGGLSFFQRHAPNMFLKEYQIFANDLADILSQSKYNLEEYQKEVWRLAAEYPDFQPQAKAIQEKFLLLKAAEIDAQKARNELKYIQNPELRPKEEKPAVPKSPVLPKTDTSAYEKTIEDIKQKVFELKAEWSEKYKMPIFALIDDDDMQRAHQAFDVLNKPHPDNESVKKAMEFLENGNFYDRLNDEDKRDTAFKNTIINEYSVILQDVDAVKNYLYEKVGTEPYLWLGIPEVKKKIQQLAEAQYNKNGYEKALAKIDKMDTEDVKSYIKKLIKDDMILGIQIIKNSH